jgi:CSLREA domain-containing protein
LALVAVVVGTAGVARAATFVVDTTSDRVDVTSGDGICATASADCSLRAAIQETNALAGADDIVVPPGIYTLGLSGTDEDLAASGDLDVRDDLTVTGAGAIATIVDGGGLDRVLHISGTVTISQVGIRNGNASVEDAGCGAQGGGVCNVGTLVMNNVTISGNTAADAGGILNGGMLTLRNATVSGNHATSSGGGIVTLPGATTTLVNVTASGNHARISGGALYQVASASDCEPATLNMNNVTIADNHAGSSGGGLYTRGAFCENGRLVFPPVSFSNTLIAANAAPYAPDCAGLVTSAGYNLIADTAECYVTGDATGNKLDATAALAPLQANGGVVETHALLPGSAALDAGNPIGTGSAANACELTDARGMARPSGARCDIGAFEATRCPTTPQLGCRIPAVRHASLLGWRDGLGTSQNRLVWKWLKGTATESAAFGDPTATTGYQLCVHDGAGNTVLEREISAAGTCDGRPCWQATAKGFRYRSAALGLQLELNAGLAGAAKVIARVKGLALATPEGDSVPLPVIVRLWNGEGECWEATYSTPSRNMPGVLSARAD